MYLTKNQQYTYQKRRKIHKNRHKKQCNMPILCKIGSCRAKRNQTTIARFFLFFLSTKQLLITCRKVVLASFQNK